MDLCPVYPIQISIARSRGEEPYVDGLDIGSRDSLVSWTGSVSMGNSEYGGGGSSYKSCSSRSRATLSRRRGRKNSSIVWRYVVQITLNQEEKRESPKKG